MRLSRILSAALLLVAFMGKSRWCSAQAPVGVGPAPDYAQAANWVCRPGSEQVCTSGLDTTVVTADGHQTVERFKPAADPPVDCFYVYPTVSREATEYSDLVATPEVQAVVNAQAGRLTSKCRVYAPVYRQVTLAGLRQRLMGNREAISEKDVSMADVQAAWDYYLKHENHGRGVIVVGHSQGTILLQRLMEKQIDGTPVQSLLISAFLAGDPSLGVPAGKAEGGTFAHIPVCAAAAQTGCVYAWGSFLAEDASPRIFGRVRQDGQVSACANPAAPSGGTGKLKYFYRKPPTAAATDAPWVEVTGQISGGCVANEHGNGFRITVDPGPRAEVYRAMLERVLSRPGWGVHVLDVDLVQGNMLDVVDAEIASWHKAH
jgi:hypothetical protein